MWLHTPLLLAERRCAIEHEVIHLENDEHCAQGDGAELRTDQEATRRHILWDALLDAARWAYSEEEMADELWVTPQVLQARVDALRADELIELAKAAQGAL